MHLVPIIPQPRVGVEESLEVARTAAVRPVKPVEERTLPPLLTYAHEQQRSDAGEIVQHPHRRVSDRPETADQGERRLACRRFHHLPILEELRSLVDRRRHKRRKTDLEPHIDVEA
ncbi:MAG TPA: hypothetical protein VMV48_05965 [Gallionellaceae bacterium]|nr:hypothetical protein [Gallionellaceae bacterium]